MKKIAVLMLVLLTAFSACFSAVAMTEEEARKAAAAVVNTTTDPTLVQSPFISVISAVQNSVVGVNNYQTYSYSSYNPYYGFGGFSGYGSSSGKRETVEQLASTGSGVVIYTDLVLTNYHVVEDATRLSVCGLNSEEQFDAKVITYDAALDIAVIHAPGLGLAPVPLGDSDRLQVGEWAICIGNPLSEKLRGSVTAGIVSALDRQIDSTTTTDKYGLKRTVTNSMIQIDAAINSGNSGGGMFNVLGQLMGVPSMKYSGSYYSGSSIEGIGLCIPVNTAKPLIEEAIIKLAKGEIAAEKKAEEKTAPADDKPLLGVTVAYVMTSSNNYLVYSGALPGGIMISDVNENSPAAAAGIQANDIIVEIDGDIVTGTTVVSKALERHAFGDTINVKVYRVEGAATASSASDLGEGEYIDFEVELFAFNVAA